MTMIEGFRSMEDSHRTDPDRYAESPQLRPVVRLVIGGRREDFEGSWIESMVPRATDLLMLTPGWAGHGSAQVSPRLVEDVMNRLLPLVMPSFDCPAPQVVPTRLGGLQLEWHRAGWDIEVEVAQTGEATFECERADGSEVRAGALPDHAEELRIVLKELA